MSLEVEKNLPTLGLEVFDILSLIKNHIVPFFSSKDRMVSHSYLIACDTNMKSVQFRPSFSFLFSLLC